jgi:hypothetical protein
MAKRANLAANVKAAAGEPPVQSVARIIDAASVTPHQTEATKETTKRSASRAGRKAIYAWVDPAEHRKLKRLSLETDRSIDALVTEAVHLLFEKHSAE